MRAITKCYVLARRVNTEIAGDMVESLYLKTFVEVVRAGSLSRAAETLHITQPAVSRRLKFMEDQYGCALLDRSGSTVRPTDAGCLVYDRACSLLEIESALVSGLHHLLGKARVSLTCTPAFGTVHLPAVLREFMLACGGSVDLKFIFNTPAEIFKGLETRLFDVAVMERCERADLSGYQTFDLPADEMVFVGSPTLGLPEPPSGLAPLLEVPLYARREGCCSRVLLEQQLSRVGRQIQDFKQVIVSDDLHAIVQAAVEGYGLAFLSRDLVAEHVESGRLHTYSVPEFDHVRDRKLVLARSGVVSGAVRRFAEVLLEHFSLPMPPALDVVQGGAAGDAIAASSQRSSPVRPAAREPAARARRGRTASRARRPAGAAKGRAGR